jgi:hypothetical protein
MSKARTLNSLGLKTILALSKSGFRYEVQPDKMKVGGKELWNNAKLSIYIYGL